MGTIIVAKWVADCFNISLYDMHIELKCIPFVENNPPVVMEKMNADEVMSTPVTMLREVDTIDNILNALRTTAHNGFPVIENTERGIFRGLILRNQLMVRYPLQLPSTLRSVGINKHGGCVTRILVCLCVRSLNLFPFKLRPAVLLRTRILS